MAMMVLSDSALPQLSDFCEVSRTMHATPIRRFENGSNIAKTVKGKKGGEFPVEAVAFFASLSGKIQTPEDELGSLIKKMHSIITCPNFKNVYVRCMKEIPKMAKLGNKIGSDDNPVWASFSRCSLEVKMPVPLSTHMMDDEICAAMDVLVGESDPSSWSPEQCAIAYMNGALPTVVKVKSEF